MANARTKTRKLKTDGSALLSKLNDDLLLVIMMHLGVFDFIAFSGVCKSWRSLALSNWNKFMVCKQPMRLSITSRLKNKECYIEDSTGRKLKTTIPQSINGKEFVGITCGYLIFFGRKTCDFWLVNPFTRKELHFPGYHFVVSPMTKNIRGILVFSPSMSGWVFVVVTYLFSNEIAFSLAGGEARWYRVSSPDSIRDIHFFKGKVYTLDRGNRLCELRISPEPTLTLLKMRNFPWLQSHIRDLEFVSSGENLYVIDDLEKTLSAFEVDFSEMKWVNFRKGRIVNYAFFVSGLKCAAAVKQLSSAGPWNQYEKLFCSDGCVQIKKARMCKTTSMWYFPHECLKDSDADMKSGALLSILED